MGQLMRSLALLPKTFMILAQQVLRRALPQSHVSLSVWYLRLRQ